jgi:hypothetical protein
MFSSTNYACFPYVSQKQNSLITRYNPPLSKFGAKQPPVNNKKSYSNTKTFHWKKALFNRTVAIASLLASALATVVKPAQGRLTQEKWPSNVHVLTSVSQNSNAIAVWSENIPSFAALQRALPNWKDDPYGKPYTMQTTTYFNTDPKADCFGRVHAAAERNGYRSIADQKMIRAASSGNVPIETWCKGAPNKKFVLLLEGTPSQTADYQAQQLDLQRMHETLQEQFKISPRHITIQKNATKASLKSSLKKIANEIKQQKINQAEVLVYYAGHGDTLERYNTGRQGPSAEGAHQWLMTSVPDHERGQTFTHEDDLKKIFKETFSSDTQITLILDSCRSGAAVF